MSLSFFDLPEDIQHIKVKFAAKADRGAVIDCFRGMCASVYVVDKGPVVSPRWVAVKVPRIPIGSSVERARRFIREIEIEHAIYKHRFVGWAYDYDMILDTPVALYRLWDGDLSDWILSPGYSVSGRLATLAYICSGLQHCRSKGVQAHQDLKPQNILMQKTIAFAELGDVMVWPMVADFGLANMFDDLGRTEGAKPYMAPEQWLEPRVIPQSDVFSLGVIICETLSRGWHPIGQKTADWWPDPTQGNSKKWQRADMWVRWASQRNPIGKIEFLIDGAREVVMACLQPDPAMRPTLGELQSLLLDLLRGHDMKAFEQADFQIIDADLQQRDHGWVYRDERLERIRRLCAEIE